MGIVSHDPVDRAEFAELIADGFGVTATELDFLDGATLGGNVASKAKVNDANGNQGVVKTTALHIGATGSETQVTATGAS